AETRGTPRQPARVEASWAGTRTVADPARSSARRPSDRNVTSWSPWSGSPLLGRAWNGTRPSAATSPAPAGSLPGGPGAPPVAAAKLAVPGPGSTVGHSGGGGGHGRGGGPPPVRAGVTAAPR